MTQEAAAATRHTPGPWGFGRTAEGHRMILGDSGNGRYVCGVQIYQTPRAAGLWEEPEREANARLIAASPSMADLLRRLVSLESDDGLPLAVWGLIREARALLSSLDGTTGPTTETEK